MKKILVLENGMVFHGEGFGADCDAIAELVFNTSMVGYQEIVSDPSYVGQAVVMSYPLMGNYGIIDEDGDSHRVYVSALIVRECNDLPSNFRFTKTLGEILSESGVPGISGIDTRELVRIIRDEGTMKGLITDETDDITACLDRIKAYKAPVGSVAGVSCNKPRYFRTKNPLYTVVAVDLGVKINMLRQLNALGCNVIAVPFDTSAQAINALRPDGVFFGGGPGNPEDLSVVTETIKHLLGKIPMLGINLGHQLIGMAYGATIQKMKCGHRGSNIPVKNLLTGRVSITTQNHSYAIVSQSLENSNIKVIYKNLIDGEPEGMADSVAKVLSAQFYPDDLTGEDKDNIFCEFTQIMKDNGGTGNAKENRY